MRIKRFSGYSEVSPGGVTYKSSQVISNYILDPIDKSISYVDNTTLGKTNVVKKKSRMVKSIIKPFRVFTRNKDK